MRNFTRTVGRNGAELTAYRAPTTPPSPPRGAVVVFPGGGYMNLSPSEADPIAQAYLDNGFHAFVLRYSVGADATFDQALEDAEAALAEIRSHSEEWGIARDRVAVIGFSAGGHLAASLSTIGTNRPDAVLLGYAITDDITLRYKPPYPAVLPHVTPKNPPTFLFATRTDAVVPVAHSLRFASALNDANVPFELHVFPEGPHGLGLPQAFSDDPRSRRAEEAFAEWFELSVRWLGSLWSDS